MENKTKATSTNWSVDSVTCSLSLLKLIFTIKSLRITVYWLTLDNFFATFFQNFYNNCRNIYHPETPAVRRVKVDSLAIPIADVEHCYTIRLAMQIPMKYM